jgi:serine phosphatase RsbU (regulator of sigma subunit)
MSIRKRMILAFSGVVLLGSLLSLYLSYSTTRAYFVEQTRSGLMQLASVMARSLDGDALRGLTILDQHGERYEAEKDKFRRFRAAVPEARFVYFYRQSERPGVLELVMDGLEPGQEDAVTERPEDRYYDAAHAPQMIEGLQAPAADRELTEDRFGVWLSGYAPVYGSDGTRVGSVGLDLPATHVRQGQRELLTLLGLSSAAALTIALLAGLYLAGAIARPIQQLAEATHAIAGGDLHARVTLSRSDELGRLGEDFNQMVQNLAAMSSALKRYTSEALETHEERMAIELGRVLLPSADLRAPGVAVTASHRPVEWGGGDTYQYFPFGAGSYVMISFGHVRASGLMAAALVTLVQSRLSQLVSNLVLRPGEILDELSRTLAQSAPGLAPMDYLCAVYDLERHWLALGTAGRVVLYLLRPGTGELQRLAAEAPPALGEAPPAEGYADSDVELEPGDRLIVCSTYATEVQDAAGESFGLERLEAALRRHAELEPEALREAVLAEVAGFAGERPVEDDLTVLVAELGAAVATGTQA